MNPPELPEELRDSLVVAVDDSIPAREALRFAAGLAAEAAKPLHVVAVWNFVIGPAPDKHPDESPSELAWQQEAERRLAALLAEELGSRTDVVTHAHAVHGNPIPTLLEVSKVASQLVVGSRGRGGFAGLLLGSTSEQLVRHGCCPVTVVRQGCTDS